jgi:hypothetical protein
MDAIMTLSANRMGSVLEVNFGMGTSFSTPHLAGASALASFHRRKSWDLMLMGNLSQIINGSLVEKKTCNTQKCAGGMLDSSQLIVLGAFTQCPIDMLKIGERQSCGESWIGTQHTYMYRYTKAE